MKYLFLMALSLICSDIYTMESNKPELPELPSDMWDQIVSPTYKQAAQSATIEQALEKYKELTGLRLSNKKFADSKYEQFFLRELFFSHPLLIYLYAKQNPSEIAKQFISSVDQYITGLDHWDRNTLEKQLNLITSSFSSEAIKKALEMLFTNKTILTFFKAYYIFGPYNKTYEPKTINELAALLKNIDLSKIWWPHGIYNKEQTALQEDVSLLDRLSTFTREDFIENFDFNADEIHLLRTKTEKTLKNLNEAIARLKKRKADILESRAQEIARSGLTPSNEQQSEVIPSRLLQVTEDEINYARQQRARYQKLLKLIMSKEYSKLK